MLIVGAVVCLVLSSGQAASVVKLNVQQDKCEWGAQYWCSSVTTADLCGKREWCATNDWLHDVIQDFPCTVTQQIVNTTRNLIRSSISYSLTKFDRALLIGKSCTILEDVRSKNQCKELVNSEDFLLKMMMLIDSDLSTQAIATAVGTCRRNIPVEEPWQSCVDFISVTQNYISKFMTQAEIEALLMNVSTILPSEEQQKYKDIIHQYSPIISKFLLQEFNPDQVCIALGLSSNKQAADNEIQTPDKDSISCILCKLTVGKVKEMLSKNTTQEKVKETLEKMCKLLPSKFKVKCKDFIDKYIPQIIQLVMSALTPEEICTKLKMCTADVQVKQILLPMKQEEDAAPVCWICTFIMGQLDSMLAQNATEQKIEVALGKVCGFLPKLLRPECNAVITEYTPLLVQFLLDHQPQEVCQYLKLCPTEVEAKQQEVAGPVCWICTFIMGKLDSMLAQNATEQQIEMALEKVCGFLPKLLRSQCSALISEYTPLLIQFLLHHRPHEVCQYLKFCPAEVEGNEIKSTSITSNNCTACKLIINQVKSVLSKNATQDEIKAALGKMCHLFPSIYESTCKDFIDKHESIIVQFLSAYSPEEICYLLRLCSSDVEVTGTEKQSTSINNIECTVCKLIMDQVKSMLSDHATQDEIKAALGKVCHLIPIFESKCKEFIDKYEPQILQLLLSAVSPDQICKMIHLCSSDVEETENVIQYPGINSIECTMCKLIMDKVKSMLSKHATQDEIKKALGQVCHLLPSIYKNKCEHFIDKYGPKIIQLLLSAISPDQICKLIQICSSDVEGNFFIIATPVLPVKQQVESGSLCLICEYFLQQLDFVLAKNTTQEQIQLVLGKVCDLLPVTLKEECNVFVAQYIPVLTEILLQVPSHKVCHFLRLCSAQAEVSEQMQYLEFVSENKAEQTSPVQEYCSSCQFALYKVQSSMDNPIWQKKSRAILYELCNFLVTGQDVCRQLVDVNVNGVINGIRALQFPVEFCHKINFCKQPVPVIYDGIKSIFAGADGKV